MANLDTIKRRYGIVGRSPALENALQTALRVASTDLSVLITGESGVGKEVISRIIHDNSVRKHEGFIAINCGALPPGTINSELFGHEKGAYTDARADRKGYFETLNGGTIFLDEIGEMPLETQSYLLRVLENGEFIRMGSNKVQRTDVRVVAATNRRLIERVSDGKFREDLYYRLATVPIDMPALRERQEDIYLLFRFFANNFAEKQSIEAVRLDEEARWLLENYRWPGNIRELKNVAERLSILSEKREMTAIDLADMMPQLLQRNLPAIRAEDRKDQGPGISMHEREILYKVLFEMREDMIQLKRLVSELISSNDLSIPDMTKVRSLQMPAHLTDAGEVLDRMVAERGLQPRNSTEDFLRDFPSRERTGGADAGARRGTTSGGLQASTVDAPVIVSHDMHRAYAESEVVEENLSLADAEKDLIRKALRKHGGRRKEAAAELGISERTLYRKIKEYDLAD
ncbi:sigma-54 dependent transcriptional regulator [Neolewinella lacunae]|uniref:Sigma-54-dependent Fis family transcriptional regulator n=1 Tax=Neolewinella lacunae TaxID=1517758 RepID=A0A923TAC3_9BACT|nr:sigma-54 dependent transcriptional regulator [Neolewinella lacunae]MBC6996013.1 sigma-54-dependent Fis family transcriptional regulator [Neolewinella lacunae]MDN3633187.1 sigma-54 dependent transcriptional regulator [Neolewinella lacunae]